MDEIRYFVSDLSDRALIPILTRALREKGDVTRVQAEWADLAASLASKGLCDRILKLSIYFFAICFSFIGM
jgi:hypothetical protein